MRKILIIFISTILVAGFGYFLNNLPKIESTKAGSEHNVSGWAWSENIGWISFNCNSLVDTNNDGIADQPLKVCDGGSNKNKLCNPGNPEAVPCPGANCRDACEVVNYGVNIDSSGNLSGYAWSENIGWIKFDPAGPYPTCPVSTCPNGSPNYSAKVDLDTGKVTGWARAYRPIEPENQTLGGWDGWILLGPIVKVKEGTEYDYGVKINFEKNPPEFEKWAWGSEVLGWISFNCSNRGVCTSTLPDEGGPSDYKVMTSIVLNQPPLAPTGLNVTWDHCAFKGISIPTFNWSTSSDPDGDPQGGYEIKWNGTSKLVEGPGNAYALTSDEARNLEWGKTYNWQVRVKDKHGNWSDWSATSTFTMPLHAYPWVEFSWTPMYPRKWDAVTFENESDLFDEISTSLWTFQDGDPSSISVPDLSSVTTYFSEEGTKKVTLTITDSDGYSCSKVRDVNVGATTTTSTLPELRYEPEEY
jgi:hypothetical protein